MARLLANTLDGPERDRIESVVMDAVNSHPDSDPWDVLILRIRGLASVFISIEVGGRVVRSWLFDEKDGPIGRRIQLDLPTG